MADQEQESVIRVREALAAAGISGQVRRLDDSARTAKEAADALGIAALLVITALGVMRVKSLRDIDAPSGVG